jgi:hypothetical protein
MNLQGFEARHLAVLDMLFTERHVGRTAERLHLSQPAVSNSLACCAAISTIPWWYAAADRCG